jgi:hypothetical protein
VRLSDSVRLAKWRANYEALKPERDALAAELSELYPMFTTKIADLFVRIAVNDEKLSRLHQARPAGVSLHLLGAELVARNLSSFSSADPSLAKELKIPNFERSNRMTYPLHRPPDWLNVMPVAYHPGADWAAHQSERAEAIRREHERTIAYYEAVARQREEREAAEAQKRGNGPGHQVGS